MKIDLQSVMTNQGRAGDTLRLLGSRAVLEGALEASNDVNPCTPFAYCCNALREWSPSNDPDAPVVAGSINLVAELCKREGGHGTCAQCSSHISRVPNQSPLSLLELLLYQTNPEVLRAKIAHAPAQAAASTGEAQSQVQWQQWPERLETWRCVLFDEGSGRPRLASTEVGQTLIMHLLELILPLYEGTHNVLARGELNLLLVPLLRAVFRYPDCAHTVYSRYHYGAPPDPKSPFHQLYALELGILEEFQSRGTTKRPEVLSDIRTPSEGAPAYGQEPAAQASDEELPPLPDMLQERANRILHGEIKEQSGAYSPRPKMSRISQLTCLVRTLITDDRSQSLPYSTYMKGIHYRQARILDRSPAAFEWEPHKKKETFLECVAERYASGWPREQLAQLFGEDANAQASEFGLPIWVQDGEITFLWLLTALGLASLAEPANMQSQPGSATPSLPRWINASLSGPLKIERGVLTGSDQSHGSFDFFGTSLEDFATRHCCLFINGTDKPYRPQPKAWALIDFLERAVVHGKPQQYARGTPLGMLASILYQSLVHTAHDATLSCLRKGCNEIVGSGEFTKLATPGQIADQARFPTFLLELILRDGQPTPYSLFFYPLTFEERAKSPVPTAFLAGTFAGLEWSFLPSVTDRQNYHLFALLDALRPIVDFEIGRVLAHEQEQFRNEERKKINAENAQKEWEQRGKTLNAVMPAVRNLTKLFSDARGLVSVIETAVDPDWSGLFTESLHGALAELFLSDRKLEITHRQGEEPSEVTTEHVTSLAVAPQLTLLYHRLVYLAREKDHYKRSDPWLRTNDKPEEFERNHNELFKSSPFLHQMFLAMLTSPDSAPYLNLLLKLLTVDSADPGRGVHIAQIAAALGMSARETRPDPSDTPDKAAQPRVRLFDRPVPGRSFSPKWAAGIRELADILSTEQAVILQPQESVSTAGFRAKARLRTAMEPFRFLRSLKILGSEVLTAGQSDHHVELLDWSVEHRNNRLFITLDCHGHFSEKAKLSLWAHHGMGDKGENQYHNLRTNFGELCRGVGSFPVFRPLPDAGAVPTPASEERFTIYEGTRTSQTGLGSTRVSKWVLVLVDTEGGDET